MLVVHSMQQESYEEATEIIRKIPGSVAVSLVATKSDVKRNQSQRSDVEAGVASAQEEVAVAVSKIASLETMLVEMSAVYENTFKEKWVPSKDKKRNVVLPKRLSK